MAGVQSRWILKQSVVSDFSSSPNDVNALHAEAERNCDYVLHCEPCPNAGIAIALSNRQIQLRSKETLALQHKFHAHNAKIQGISALNFSPQVLASCSEDGMVHIWDFRTSCDRPTLAHDLAIPIFSFAIDPSDQNVLVGSDRSVNLTNLQSGQKVTEFSQIHNDVVTKVAFHSTQPHHIVTGSEDGIVCYFDYRITDDDDIESIINVESAVRTFGFFGREEKLLFCLTGSETLSLWNIDKAERLAQYDNLREELRAFQLPSDCFLNGAVLSSSTLSVSPALTIFSANYKGDIGMINVHIDESNAQVTLQHGDTLHNGHIDAPCSISYDKDAQTIYTGGEDSRLCQWHMSNAGPARHEHKKRIAFTDSVTGKSARELSRPY